MIRLSLDANDIFPDGTTVRVQKLKDSDGSEFAVLHVLYPDNDSITVYAYDVPALRAIGQAIITACDNPR